MDSLAGKVKHPQSTYIDPHPGGLNRLIVSDGWTPISMRFVFRDWRKANNTMRKRAFNETITL